MNTPPKLIRFENHVLSKYQIFNSIFLTLPFDKIYDTGTLLPLFHKLCKQSFREGKKPDEIVKNFFDNFLPHYSIKEQNDMLFRFIQYIERQIVLFDSIEDAAFSLVNNMDGVGSLRSSKEIAVNTGKLEELKKHLEEFKVMPVLTAHPTQFYPGSVLGIITDLIEAIEKNDLVKIKKLLAQLGITPFFKKEKPTPYDEAVSLIWYLKNIFYYAFGNIADYISSNILEKPLENDLLKLGFWPGGDRDGNPFVTTEITLKVARLLRRSIFSMYWQDIRYLKRRLTFKGIEKKIGKIAKKIEKNTEKNTPDDFSPEELINELLDIRKILIKKYQSLFLDELDSFINKVRIFGFHFATLDIREDSRVHHKVFEDILKELKKRKLFKLPKDFYKKDETKQLEILSQMDMPIQPDWFKETDTVKTLEAIQSIQTIQKENGEKGAHRYIISNTQSAVNVMELFAMLQMGAFGKTIPVDIVPLFETVEDLKNSGEIMQKLYTNPEYLRHLKSREKKQIIMLGFSDGTKDGGYLMANWSIYKAKEMLTRISGEHNIEVIFFDGRGGPPARGGGKAHQFYASLGPEIENKEIQLTIQGQTISSKYGTVEVAQYNIEQLISSGIKNNTFNKQKLSKKQKKILDTLAQDAYTAYQELKKHPAFLPFLENRTTLKYFSKVNIGSRPVKRSKKEKLDFSDLRAIPFVGSWSQLKLNVPGFYGMGTALSKYKAKENLNDLKDLYQKSGFFKALIDNSMMSLAKTFFELTSYMKNDPVYGDFWQKIHKEYRLSRQMLLEVTGFKELMENYPAAKASIQTREDIVLPLLTIQQYALQKVQELKTREHPDKELLEIYEKMVVRSMFGNINAGRNSA